MIVIEDLAVKNLVRNRSLSKAISDCGWGDFRRQLEYKCGRAGRHLIVIDRWYPELQNVQFLRASAAVAEHPDVAVPVLRYPARRDVNAAKNTLAALAVSACGADVRHSGSSRVRSAVRQEPQLVKAGIPVLQGGE